MGAPKTGNVRNVVLVGQGGVGKTSLAEAMLHLSGKTARLGGHDGTKPTLDYDPEEVKRAFSISTTIAPIDWKGARINVLDAPCYPDFIGDAFAAMSVCETALFVVDAEAGPQPTTVKLWYAAEDLRLARAVFVNRLSRSEASFATTMDLLQERFGTRLGAVTLPWGEGEDFDGIIDLVRMKARHCNGTEAVESEIPEEYRAQAEEAHDHLCELVAEADDELMMKYLEGEETLTQEELEKQAEEGAIFTREPAMRWTGFEVGRRIGRIVNGDEVSKIPFVEGDHYTTVVNTKAAKDIGVTILPSIMRDIKDVSKPNESAIGGVRQ